MNDSCLIYVLVVFDLPLLEPLVHAGLYLLPECIHLISLLLYEGSLGSHDLLVSLLHVPLTLLFLHLRGLYLDLMGLRILLLAG